MAYQLRLTTKSSATSREKFHLRAGADKAARGGKKRAVTLVAPFISHHLQLQYPGRYTDLFACYEMRAITFANMRRHIHMYIYIYIDLEGKHSVDDFSSFLLFPPSFVREISQIIIPRSVENNCEENRKRRLRIVKAVRFSVAKRREKKEMRDN